jgi:hypothetical protein
MPIVGLNDLATIVARYPCIGTLHKGSEKKPKIDKNTKLAELDKYGKQVMIQGEDLDHFRFTSDDPKVLKAFEDAYPTIESRRSINCIILGNDAKTAFHSWFESWNASRQLIRRCDGEFIVREYVDGDYVDYFGEQRPRCKGCPKRKKADKPLGSDCSGVLRLRILIKELVEAGFVGYVKTGTSSIHDMSNLPAHLFKIEEDFGSIARVPVRLERYFAKVSSRRPNGGRALDDKWLLRISPDPEWLAERMRFLESQRRLALVGGETLALPDRAPAFALPPTVGRGQAIAPNASVETLYNFYRSLELSPSHFSQHLQRDLRQLNLPWERIDAVKEEWLPKLVGVRLADVASRRSTIFGDDQKEAFKKAQDRSRQWLCQRPDILKRLNEGQYGAVGIAWLQYLNQQEEEIKAAAESAKNADAIVEVEAFEDF